jgi:transposase
MSISFICHAIDLRDYFYKTTRFVGGILTFEIFPKPEAIKCPDCKSKSVVKRGVIKRNLRTIPVGSRPVILRTTTQRVWCPICKFARQIKLFLSDSKFSTMVRYAVC